jgi:hypothetical protein
MSGSGGTSVGRAPVMRVTAVEDSPDTPVRKREGPRSRAAPGPIARLIPDPGNLSAPRGALTPEACTAPSEKSQRLDHYSVTVSVPTIPSAACGSHWNL